MKKFALALLFLGMACLPMKADIVVKPSVEKGNIKPMNAVNNGPERSGASQQSDNFEAYKAARIPYARTHDSSFNANYGSEHTVDISAVFPDFSRDPGKAENYDFAVTDKYLRNIQDAGTKVFFRLGQKIEHYVRKYNVCPPSDNRKWARICEHIIRHYNEGWADGMHLGIEYWEIWNEPDLDDSTWKGTPEQFYDLYETTAKHLKKCFPELKIGGPAATGRRDWSEAFLAEMARRKVPIDFYSWHRYTVDPGNFVMNATYFRELLDSNGYTGTESIIDEWNYVKGWRETYPASLQVIASEKGGAYTAAVMCAVQDCPVDMLMYYDARTGTRFNGLFDYQSPFRHTMRCTPGRTCSTTTGPVWKLFQMRKISTRLQQSPLRGRWRYSYPVTMKTTTTWRPGS